MVLGLSWNNQQHPGKIGGHTVSHADSPWAVVCFPHFPLSGCFTSSYIWTSRFGRRGGVGERDFSIFAHHPGKGLWDTALGYLRGYCSVISVDTKADNSDTICRWLKHRKIQNRVELSHFHSSWFEWEYYNKPRKLSAWRLRMHKRQSLFSHSTIIKSWNSLSYQVRMAKSKKAVKNRLDKFMDGRSAGVY